MVAHGEAGGVAFGGFDVHGGGWGDWGRAGGSGVGRCWRVEGVRLELLIVRQSV